MIIVPVSWGDTTAETKIKTKPTATSVDA